MILTIVVILLILWLFGILAHIGGGLINLLLIIALVLAIYRLIARRG